MSFDDSITGKAAATILGLAICIPLAPYIANIALTSVALVPTTTNVDHLNSIAEQEWDEEGYDYIRTTEEEPTSMGLFSGYDLHVGGGRITCELENTETGETCYGSLHYDSAGLLNRHVFNTAAANDDVETPSSQQSVPQNQLAAPYARPSF